MYTTSKGCWRNYESISARRSIGSRSSSEVDGRRVRPDMKTGRFLSEPAGCGGMDARVRPSCEAALGPLSASQDAGQPDESQPRGAARRSRFRCDCCHW